MDEHKRKSIKKLKIEVELKQFEKMFLLVFTLNKPYYKVCIGATRSFSFCEAEDLGRKINSIFKNATGENVFCLEDEIIRELSKIEQIILKA